MHILYIFIKQIKNNIRIKKFFLRKIKMSAAECDTPGCGKPSKLRCPTCVKSQIVAGSNFCSQVELEI